MFGLDSFVNFLGGQASALNVASTLFNIYAGDQKAKQTSAMYDYEAAKQQQQANLIEGTAQVAADNVRTRGKRDASTVQAQYGASGVDSTSGSAAVVSGELSRRVELDALNTLLQGKYQAYGQRVGAQESLAASTNAKNMSVWNRSASLLGGVQRQIELSKWNDRTGKFGDGVWTDAGTPSMSNMA